MQSEWIKKLPQIFKVIHAHISDFGTFFKTSETFGFIFSSFCVNHSTVLATLGLPPMFSQIFFTDIFPCSSAGKESACNYGDPGLIPGLGRSPEEKKGYPLQYSGLENSMDCTAHGVTKSQIWLRDFHFHILL